MIFCVRIKRLIKKYIDAIFTFAFPINIFLQREQSGCGFFCFSLSLVRFGRFRLLRSVQLIDYYLGCF